MHFFLHSDSVQTLPTYEIWEYLAAATTESDIVTSVVLNTVQRTCCNARVLSDSVHDDDCPCCDTLRDTSAVVNARAHSFLLCTVEFFLQADSHYPSERGMPYRTNCHSCSVECMRSAG